jgi:hypothetical protein
MFESALGTSLYINAIICINAYLYLLMIDHFPHNMLTMYLDRSIEVNYEHYIVWSMILTGYYTIMGGIVWLLLLIA